MSKALGFLVIVVAAFITVMGALSVWAGIAKTFPTTEDAFIKVGSLEISNGVYLVIIGAAFIGVAYFLVRFAASRE
jgi:hypothetical protein